MGGVVPRLVVLSSIGKQAEQVTGSKPVSNTFPQPLLGFLPLACCHPLHATRHEDRSLPHLSLSQEKDRISSITGSNIAYCLGECIQALAPVLLSCVLEHTA